MFESVTAGIDLLRALSMLRHWRDDAQIIDCVVLDHWQVETVAKVRIAWYLTQSQSATDVIEEVCMYAKILRRDIKVRIMCYLAQSQVAIHLIGGA